MPAILAGVCCWIFIWLVSGTSCWIRALSGFPCPGCGSTRAMVEICRGDIKTALEYHPLIFVSIAIIAFYIITIVFKINLAAKSETKWMKIFSWGFVILYVGTFITRMILFYPRVEPMTYLDTSVFGRVIGFFKSIFNG